MKYLLGKPYAAAWLLVGMCFAGQISQAADVPQLVKTLRSVGAEGKGNKQAAAAMQELTQASADNLPQVLQALDGANPLAANWLRAAVESMADKALKSGGTLPAKELEAFVLDTSHDSRARRLAFDLLERVDATARPRLIPNMLNDPSVELRRDAVRLQMDKANALFKADKDAEAQEAYQTALNAARDEDQITIIVKRLGELGQTVDLAKHFGFLMNWHLIGPFDNGGKQGFNAVYPPEKEINLDSEYQGRDGVVKWKAHSTKDSYGLLDLNKIEAFKGAVTYAAHEFTAEQAQTVQIRLGTPNAWKLWLNGELLFAREEYHRGTKVDQYEVTGKLKPGVNRILLKICQNEQTEDWAQRWQFQLRVCDQTGTAVLSATRPPSEK